jgi:hypothetical protein
MTTILPGEMAMALSLAASNTAPCGLPEYAAGPVLSCPGSMFRPPKLIYLFPILGA